LRLLLGFETPDEGQVLVDGRPLQDLDPHVLRAEMGAVTQDAVLLGSSIRDTVTGGHTLDDVEVWAALERAAVAEEVRAMPMGLETLVMAATVSGGQQQRLLLARALVRSVRLLILDEATSAMDDLSQAAVMASLEEMNATRVLVAHRLSTVRRRRSHRCHRRRLRRGGRNLRRTRGSGWEVRSLGGEAVGMTPRHFHSSGHGRRCDRSKEKGKR